jgi:hypothetical protein
MEQYDHYAILVHIFMADPAEKISIAIMGCQLMRRLSDNYPTIGMYNLQNFCFSGVTIWTMKSRVA